LNAAGKCAISFEFKERSIRHNFLVVKDFLVDIILRVDFLKAQSVQLLFQSTKEKEGSGFHIVWPEPVSISVAL